jgi:mannose-6-phosphate isomerase
MGEPIIGYPLKFNPITKERIWGGKKLAQMFDTNLDAPIGEVWTLSDHPSDPSICLNGPLKGKTLSEIISVFPEFYLGKAWSGQRFPLLIKFLHAADDLSVQIHPDDEYAKEHEGDFGKTEAWFVLDAEPGAKINYGHHFASREEYYDAVRQGKVKDYLEYREVKKGDFIFVPSRTLHALMKGIMIIEIQQTSDVTYRVYDWDRVDTNGQSRQLHIDKAADVMRYESLKKEQEPLEEIIQEDDRFKHVKWVSSPYFSIEKIDLKQKTSISVAAGNSNTPDVLVVIEGEGEFIYRDSQGNDPASSRSIPLQHGDTVLIPSNIKQYSLKGDTMSILRTYY